MSDNLWFENLIYTANPKVERIYYLMLGHFSHHYEKW